MTDEVKARAEHYQALADEALALANYLKDPTARRAMRQLALTYDRLALMVEEWDQTATIAFVSSRKPPD